jgi:hypothetical protein
MNIYKDNNIPPKTKCAVCGELARDIFKQYGKSAIEEGSYSEKLDGWVCYPCRESEESSPQGTIIIYDPNKGTVTKYTVMEHEDLSETVDINDPEELENLNFECPEDTEDSPIQFEYHHTDAWRGYYEPKAEDWDILHSDCILAGSEDAKQLKEFDTDIKKILWELGYEFAICLGSTSNLFSCGYDIMIKKTDKEDALKRMTLYMKLMQLNTKYRDPERFRMTALTGKSGDFDEKDRLLSEASKRLERGEDFETVKEDILKRAIQK